MMTKEQAELVVIQALHSSDVPHLEWEAIINLGILEWRKLRHVLERLQMVEASVQQVGDAHQQHRHNLDERAETSCPITAGHIAGSAPPNDDDIPF